MNNAPLVKDAARSPCFNPPTSVPVAAETESSRAKTFPALPALEAVGLSIGGTNATSVLAHRRHRYRRPTALRTLPLHHCHSPKLLRWPLRPARTDPDHRWRIRLHQR